MMEVLEWLVLVIIIGFQARAFWQGRQDSAQLAALFPLGSGLRLTRHQDEATGQQVDVLLVVGATPEFEAMLAPLPPPARASARSTPTKHRSTTAFRRAL